MPTKTQSVADSACEQSPTKAHHWVLGSPGSTMAGECKYCHTAREFRPFEENIGFNNSPKKNRAPRTNAKKS